MYNDIQFVKRKLFHRARCSTTKQSWLLRNHRRPKCHSSSAQVNRLGKGFHARFISQYNKKHSLLFSCAALYSQHWPILVPSGNSEYQKLPQKVDSVHMPCETWSVLPLSTSPVNALLLKISVFFCRLQNISEILQVRGNQGGECTLTHAKHIYIHWCNFYTDGHDKVTIIGRGNITAV